jgi:hypothetical protein
MPHLQWNDKPAAVKLLLYRKDGSPFQAYVLSCPLVGGGRGGTARHTLLLLVDITSTRPKRVGK